MFFLFLVLADMVSAIQLPLLSMHSSVLVNNGLYIVGGYQYYENSTRLPSGSGYYVPIDHSEVKPVQMTNFKNRIDSPCLNANETIYCLYGSVNNGTDALSDIVKFDTRQNTWSNLNITGLEFSSVQAVWLKQKLYVFGGFYNTSANCRYCVHNQSVRVVDPALGTITELPVPSPAPAARGQFGMTAISDHEFLIAGGISQAFNSTPIKYNDFWIYDTDSNQWSAFVLQDQPVFPQMSSFTMQYFNSKVYLFGGLIGISDGALSNLMWIIDLKSLTSTLVSGNAYAPSPRHMAASSVVGKTLVISGGETDFINQSGDSKALFYFFDLCTGQWTGSNALDTNATCPTVFDNFSIIAVSLVLLVLFTCFMIFALCRSRRLLKKEQKFKKLIEKPESVLTPDSLESFIVAEPFTRDSLASMLSYNSISELEQHTATREYISTRPDEIRVRIGDEIGIRLVFDDGWAEGINLNTCKIGVFPSICIKPRTSFLLPFRKKEQQKRSTSLQTQRSRILHLLDQQVKKGLISTDEYFRLRSPLIHKRLK